MSYDEARAAAAAASRRNEEKRMMLQQQVQPITHFNALSLSYEEARARAAAASRQHDAQSGHSNASKNWETHSPLKHQDSFGCLRRMEGTLSNRVSEDQGGMYEEQSVSRNRQRNVQVYNQNQPASCLSRASNPYLTELVQSQSQPIRQKCAHKRMVTLSPLKRQESFGRLRRLEGALSSRVVEDKDDNHSDQSYSRNRQGNVQNQTASHFSQTLKNYPNSTEQVRSQSPLQLEISPGIFATVRGANETWAAVEDGNVKHSDCICCAIRLICIADAEYALCPECRVVFPLSSSSFAHGIGLGMALDEYEALLQEGRRPLGPSLTDHGPRRW